MIRRGGGRSGYGGRDSEAPSSRSGDRRSPASQTHRQRFPSDHSYLKDHRSAADSNVRFPSDSTRGSHDDRGRQGSSFPQPQRPGRDSYSTPQTEGGRPPRYPRHGGRSPSELAGPDARRYRLEGNELIPVGADPRKGESALEGFELFCAYYLGLMPNGQYRPSSALELAERFGITEEALLQALSTRDLHPDVMRLSDFDLEMARLDIEVSPPGVSKIELARGLYDEYRSALQTARDSLVKPAAKEEDLEEVED